MHTPITPNPILQKAIENGNLIRVQDLIMSGENMEAKNYKGQSALHYAVTEYQIPIIEFLPQKGAKIEEKDIRGAFCSLT